ncbi:hypothetical protein NL348_27925, partial [Klebsiella pneumoniae]|nr:hypothetical protein [Klebsiella pneumoniae]
MSSYGVIGPYFFDDDNGLAITVTSSRYVAVLETFVVEQQKRFPPILNTAWFQQDGATSHTAQISMTAVRRLFGKR